MVYRLWLLAWDLFLVNYNPKWRKARCLSITIIRLSCISKWHFFADFISLRQAISRGDFYYEVFYFQNPTPPIRKIPYQVLVVCIVDIPNIKVTQFFSVIPCPSFLWYSNSGVWFFFTFHSHLTSQFAWSI